MTTSINQIVDDDFVRALPKAELHAHLSGSISPSVLQGLWKRKRAQGQCLDLEDPLTAIRQGERFVDVVSFFPLFDKYIYALVDNVWAVKFVTGQVLQDFEDDGVGYLELRTTPRENLCSNMTKQAYVTAVSETLREWNESRRLADSANSVIQHGNMIARLILSIDRKMTAVQADEVVDLAIKYKFPREVDDKSAIHLGRPLEAPVEERFVVGVDLCGNPLRGEVSTFTPAFGRAKRGGLGITVHFAEVPQSSTGSELSTILSWEPDRLGHVINVPQQYADIIKKRKLAMELCLSCNVLTGLTTGGFAEHHFGRWLKTGCAIALSTDDVGVFGSPLSNEYLLAAKHFDMPPAALVWLSKSAACASFGGRKHMLELIRRFEQRETGGGQDATEL
ncbi:hypothetical protein LTR36_001278 [Oleoguttula mirabilis]|uniref:Adenosine deaminase domain-containing protein n=1 Tax=Oleoguttula mirabilis TaxID=1507867 RepID=A0AAV9JPY0_9PEZI|nr:hypothetical protein LTR36_001278 [Oleoguttula mirabilis]